MSWLREVIIAYFAHAHAWRLHRQSGDVASANDDIDLLVLQFAALPGAALTLIFAFVYSAAGGSFPAPVGVLVVAVLLLVFPTVLILNICKNEKREIQKRGAAIMRHSSGRPGRSLVFVLAPIAALLLGLGAIWIA